MIDFEDPAAVLAERDALEEEVTRAVERVYDDFARRLREQALAAGTARTLTAVGSRKRDPLAYSNVMSAWREAVRTLAAERDTVTYGAIADMLLESNIPIDMHDATVDLLRRARAEEWTEYRTKVELGRLLIPRRGDALPGRDFKASIRAIARTASTRTNGLMQLGRLVEAGVPRKRWVSAHDDRVRHTHADAHGQVVPRDFTFQVGSSRMAYPGDPSAPLEETWNCRCVLVGVRAAPRRRR